MKLIVGLGNPGRKYVGTRHNVGFEVIFELVRRHGSGRSKAKFKGETIDANINGEKVVLLTPLTYMNLSGTSVRAAFDFYKIETDDLLVICDDISLPTAKLRFRSKGSAGGQKGLADILRCLRTDQVPRLRIGVGQPRPGWETSDFVLSRFGKEELDEIYEAVKLSSDAVVTWLTSGIEACMNQYN